MSDDIRQQSATQIKDNLNKAISLSDKTKGVVCPDKNFTRNRVFNLDTMQRCILGMGGQSLNKELYAYFNKCGVVELNQAKKSAFNQQRDKITPELFQNLFYRFNSLCSAAKTYKGYKLLAVDGSDIYIAHNEESDTYMQYGTNKGYNLFHLNAIYDIENAIYTDATIIPRPVCDERKEMLSMVTNTTFTDKSILIADRGYAAFNVFEHLKEIDNLDFLFRVKNSWIKETADMPMEEFDREITLELRTGQSKADKELYKQGKAKWITGYNHHKGKSDVTNWDFEPVRTVSYRVVRIKINDTGTDADYETIITSLNRFEFPLEELKLLYHKRWSEEVSFRDLKYNIGLINFHSKKEEFIKQEIWASLIMYNFCSLIAQSVIIKNDKGNKWTYKVNFSMAVYLCMDYFRHRGNAPPDIENIILQYTEPIRPDRADNRKFRPKHPIWFMYRVA